MVDAVTGGLINMAEAGNVQIQLRDQQNNIVQAGSRHFLRQGHRLIAAGQQQRGGRVGKQGLDTIRKAQAAAQQKTGKTKRKGTAGQEHNANDDGLMVHYFSRFLMNKPNSENNTGIPMGTKGTLTRAIKMLEQAEAQLWLVEEPAELHAGDYICYPADRPHLFRALEPDTLAVLVS